MPQGRTTEQKMKLEGSRLVWESPVANTEPYRILVTASNIVGSHSVYVEVFIPPSYTAVVDIATVNGEAVNMSTPTGLTLPPFSVVKFQGRITSTTNRSVGKGEVVDIWISRSGQSPSVKTVATAVFGYFQYTW
jgi:hypothetical protein